MSVRSAAPELHLPDLPEVQLGGHHDGEGPAAPASGPAPGWGRRLADGVAGRLPVLLMAALALGTWWLVRSTPSPAPPPTAAPQRVDPDYTMRGFSITRFDAAGRVVLRIDGDLLRHYPVSDRMEIDGVHITATGPDGRTTDARARRAVANADGSEVQLLGGAQVTSTLGDGQRLDVRGEFLHALLRFERLRSHLPVTVRHGAAETRAGGLDFDNLQRTMQFLGPVRATWPPGPRAGAPAPDAAEAASETATGPVTR